MTDSSGSDPVEIRVLAALMSGAATALEVAIRAGESVEVVGPVLDRSVLDETVIRLGRGGTPSYSLTPKGLRAIGLHQGGPGPGDGAGQVDPAVVPTVTEKHDVADATRDSAFDLPPVLPSDAGPEADEPHLDLPGVEPVPSQVRWRHVVYAALYVLVGLAFLLLAPVVGVVVIIAGLVLGTFALRPLWRPHPARTTNH